MQLLSGTGNGGRRVTDEDFQQMLKGRTTAVAVADRGARWPSYYGFCVTTSHEIAVK